MGATKRGNRKIVRNGRVFYWCVKYDIEDESRLHLIIKSDDKKFIVSYMIGQNNTKPHERKTAFITNKGKEFKGLSNLGRFWERFIVPEWEDEIITPSLVAQIIDWCFTAEDVTPVDWQGNVIRRAV
jgi:hypothetical protein